MKQVERSVLRSFSIVETVVALGIMALVMMSMIAAEASGSALRQTTRQTEWINTEVQDYFEELRQQNNVASVRNLVNGGDWISLGTKSSHTHESGGLVGVSNGILVTAASQRILTEAECAAIFGGTYDLDRDGTADSAASNPDDYQTVVPVQLTVTWTNTLSGGAATRTLRFNTIVYPVGSMAP